MERRNIYIGVLIIFIGVTAIGLESIRPDEQPSDVGNSTIVAENLDIPWAIEFLPEGDMLVTERPGTLLRIEQENGSFQESYQVEGVEHRGEGGLLGLALHPNYTQNNWIYLYMTTSPENSDLLQNRVVRYKFEDNRLSNSTTIIEGLPGAPYHDGGRIAFGPENKLYVTAGDATKPQWAQDTNRLAGKILRLNPDGSVTSDNPFGNEVYSYGHRNPQGITWINNQLWATEHGQTGRDELNKINSGDNYGWPVIEGNETVENMETPVINSGPDTTWAPAAATSINNSIYFAGLRGNGLYQAEIEDGAVTNLDKHLTSFGRLREVELGPNGYLYISTSNTDGRGIPAGNDDKIIKVNPENLT